VSVSARLVVVVTLISMTAAASPRQSVPDSPWAINGVDVVVVVDGMTLEQKIGQMLLLGFGGTQMDATIASFLDEMQPGGVALFTRNITGPEQTMKLVQGIRDHDVVVAGRSVPPFVAVDQEGGNVVRLKSQAAVLPSAMALGAADDVELARQVGRTLGQDLVSWGFNMNLAPVLDVNSNPRNPVIGIRSFGGDAKRVAEIGVGYARGLGDAGVVAVAKHFPGHGDTDVDSHYGLPVLQHDRARLFDVELRPFARAFAEGLPAIMTAHIVLPMIAEGGDVPATVSHKVLTGLLREELAYDGLVITDGLEMQGIVDHFRSEHSGAGEAAVQAVVAGADMVMVLWSVEKKREVRQCLLDAATSGRLPRDRVDQAVRRVLEAKARAGLFTRPVVDIKLAKRELAQHDRKSVRDVARRAVTIVKDRKRSLPLGKDTVVVVAAAQPAFLQGIAAGTHARTLALSWTPNKERVRKDAIRLVDMAREADVVVIGMQNGDHAALVRAVQTALPDKPIVVVSFGSPYLIYSFPNVSGYVCAFGWRDDSAKAAARVLTGAIKAEGRMPVTLAAIVDADAESVVTACSACGAPASVPSQPSSEAGPATAVVVGGGR
jgi:beta-N-acetylhexosaminidase